MTIGKTRFILSIMGITMVFVLALVAILKGDAVTPPLCIPVIGGIAGYYSYGKTKNNDTFMTTQKPTQ